MSPIRPLGEAAAPRRVFVVEDDERLRGLLQTYLEIQGDLVCCGAAASAEEALPLIAGAEPDMLMADLSLPGMSGVELIRRVIGDGSAMPCLILSGHKERQYVRQALDAGARGYVLKGDPTAIAASLRRCWQGETVVPEGLEPVG